MMAMENGSASKSKSSQRLLEAMELAGVNDDRDAVIESILKRLDRVEKKLRAMEKDRRPSIVEHPSKNHGRFKERFSENISIIGLREAVGSRHKGVQLIWFTFFIICLMSMGYFVFKTCTEYWDEPTATKVKLIEDVQYDYPTMLLCPDTWLDADKAIDDGLSVDGLQYALGYLVNYYVHPPPYRIESYERAQTDFYTYYIRKGYANLVDFFKFVSLDSDDFFYKCPFCLNQTFHKVLMSEAICYELHMHPSPGNAPVVSSLDTLEVVVPDRTRGLLAQKTFWRLFLGSDLRLGESTRRYAEIYPHQTNTVQFITHRFISVGTLENPCIPPSANNYSYARCVMQCFVEKYGGLMFLMTACTDRHMPGCDNSMLTPNQTFQFYAEDIWHQLNNMENNEKGGDEAPAHCYERCPSMCERMIYTIDVQAHPIVPIVDLSIHPADDPSFDTLLPSAPIDSFFHSNNQSARLKPKASGISTPANLTRLYFLNSAAVYGGVLTFQEISTYSFETMVGNVGGMLSLWMGVSIMSLIQLGMFLVTESCRGKKRREAPIPKDAKSQNGGASIPNMMDSPIPPGEYLLQSTIV